MVDWAKLTIMGKIRIVACLSELTCSTKNFEIWRNQHIVSAKNAGATSMSDYTHTKNKSSTYYFVYEVPMDRLSDLRERLNADLKEPAGMPTPPLAMYPNRWMGTLVGDQVSCGLDTSTPATVTLLFMDKLEKIF